MTYKGASVRSVINYVITNNKGEDFINGIDLMESDIRQYNDKNSIRNEWMRKWEGECEVITLSQDSIEEYRKTFTIRQGAENWAKYRTQFQGR